MRPRTLYAFLGASLAVAIAGVTAQTQTQQPPPDSTQPPPPEITTFTYLPTQLPADPSPSLSVSCSLGFGCTTSVLPCYGPTQGVCTPITISQCGTTTQCFTFTFTPTTTTTTTTTTTEPTTTTSTETTTTETTTTTSMFDFYPEETFRILVFDFAPSNFSYHDYDRAANHYDHDDHHRASHYYNYDDYHDHGAADHHHHHDDDDHHHGAANDNHNYDHHYDDVHHYYLDFYLDFDYHNLDFDLDLDLHLNHFDEQQHELFDNDHLHLDFHLNDVHEHQHELQLHVDLHLVVHLYHQHELELYVYFNFDVYLYVTIFPPVNQHNLDEHQLQLHLHVHFNLDHNVLDVHHEHHVDHKLHLDNHLYVLLPLKFSAILFETTSTTTTETTTTTTTTTSATLDAGVNGGFNTNPGAGNAANQGGNGGGSVNVPAVVGGTVAGLAVIGVAAAAVFLTFRPKTSSSTANANASLAEIGAAGSGAGAGGGYGAGAAAAAGYGGSASLAAGAAVGAGVAGAAAARPGGAAGASGGFVSPAQGVQGRFVDRPGVGGGGEQVAGYGQPVNASGNAAGDFVTPNLLPLAGGAGSYATNTHGSGNSDGSGRSVEPAPTCGAVASVQQRTQPIPSPNHWRPTMKLYGSKRHNFRYFAHHPKTLREQHYLGCLAAVLNKPRWWEKLEDDAIRAKWSDELPLEEADRVFLFDELRFLRNHKLKLDQDGKVVSSPLTPMGTHVSDTAVDEGLVEEPVRHLSGAEKEALDKQRWHPGSENITLDIFHPSNHCLAYGTTNFSHALFGDKVFQFPKNEVLNVFNNGNNYPENPRYPGGGWHLEGTENESPYDRRQIVGAVSEETMNVQSCGHAEASRTGRVLVFPNSNQHRVPPFELEDPTKPGHRKMLVFLLVHPDTRVPSTLHVPPQQWEWGLEELRRVLPAQMPTDCLPLVLSHLKARSEAEDKKMAVRVMEDRTASHLKDLLPSHNHPAVLSVMTAPSSLLAATAAGAGAALSMLAATTAIARLTGSAGTTLVEIKLDAIHLTLISFIVALAFYSASASNSTIVVQSRTTNQVAVSTTPSPTPAPAPAPTEKIVPAPAAANGPVTYPENPYKDWKESLVKSMVEAADMDAQPADGTVWTSVLSQGSNKPGSDFKIEVHRKNNTDFCFRVVADMEGTPEEVFDMLSDITTRQSWDEICEGGGIVQVLGPDSKVQFMHSKGFWPTAPRDALVVGFIQRLEDGRYLNVTRSVESAPGFTPRAGSVRMQASLAGQIVGKHPSGKERLCRVVQIMDGDLGGWLPKSLVAMITTQAMPLSLRRVNKMMREKKDHRTSSILIEEAEGKRAITASNAAPAADATTAAPASAVANGHAPAAAVASANGQLVVGGVDVVPVLKSVGKALGEAQPWLVALLFLAAVARGRRAKAA
ncbi:hypothetical protein HDU96_001728 [Phlyctochytrium bullatum]|nr:hypothetical protein HDU96_001728 [Phlyctochytrium bullatum]